LTDKVWLIKVWVLLFLCSLFIRLFPFKYFLKVYGASLSLPRLLTKGISNERLSTLKIKAAGAFPFSVNCLPIALAYKWFLRHDKTYNLCIGVQQRHVFEFRAWVESNGKVSINETKDDSFSLLWQII
jgi:hypothetical protein